MTRGLQDLAAGLLTRDAYAGATGAGVRVAVIDSGVEVARIGTDAVLDGVSFGPAGTARAGAVDRHGHGTAVVSTIRAIAPGVAIIPVQVFDRELRATAEALIAAIDWAAGSGAHLINLSLGTTNLAHRLRLGEALVRAARAGVAVVAADLDESGTTWLPGSLPLAVGVSMDRGVARDTAVIAVTQEGAVRRLRARANGVSMALASASRDRDVRSAERGSSDADDAPGISDAPASSGGDPDAATAAQGLTGAPGPAGAAGPADAAPSGVSFAVATVTGLLALHLSSRTHE